LDSGYTPEGYSVIGGRFADSSFLRLGQPEAKVRIRTALKKEINKEELSGIYGVKWHKQRINGTDTEISQLGPQSYAARWETGNYVFAVQGQGMEPAAFRSLLANSLVEDTEHYFIPIQKKPVKDGKKTVYSNL
jgi:hypothetical protein